jgi:hypothetical protein
MALVRLDHGIAVVTVHEVAHGRSINAGPGPGQSVVGDRPGVRRDARRLAQPPRPRSARRSLPPASAAYGQAPRSGRRHGPDRDRPVECFSVRSHRPLHPRCALAARATERIRASTCPKASSATSTRWPAGSKQAARSCGETGPHRPGRVPPSGSDGSRVSPAGTCARAEAMKRSAQGKRRCIGPAPGDSGAPTACRPDMAPPSARGGEGCLITATRGSDRVRGGRPR